MEIKILLSELIIVAIGWVLFSFALIFIIMLLKFTPAFKFLRAWWKRQPIFNVTYRDGQSEFMIGKATDNSSADLKDGTVLMTEGSHTLEKKTKVPIYTIFGEYSFAIPKEYPAIIQELKDSNLKINNYSDLQHLIRLSIDETYESEYLSRIENLDQKKAAQEIIKKVKNLKIEIKPYKTYRMYDLANMFPNNISPTYVRAKVINEITRLRNKLMRQDTIIKFLLTSSIAFFIVAIAAIFLFKFVKGPECGKMVCECGSNAAQAAATLAKNLTM